MDSRFWQHKTNRPDGRHRAGGIAGQETLTTRGRRCITQQVRLYGRGASGSGCHPLHPKRGRSPPWPQRHRSLGATTRVAVCLPRFAQAPTPSVKFARVQLIILVIVIVLFGASRLAGLGQALGSSVREFRNSVRDDEAPPMAQSDER